MNITTWPRSGFRWRIYDTMHDPNDLPASMTLLDLPKPQLHSPAAVLRFQGQRLSLVSSCDRFAHPQEDLEQLSFDIDPVWSLFAKPDHQGRVESIVLNCRIVRENDGSKGDRCKPTAVGLWRDGIMRAQVPKSLVEFCHRH